MNKAQRWFWRLLSLPLAGPLFLACYLARQVAEAWSDR